MLSSLSLVLILSRFYGDLLKYGDNIYFFEKSFLLMVYGRKKLGHIAKFIAIDIRTIGSMFTFYAKSTINGPNNIPNTLID